MEARATLFGHPIHQMLIVFPVELLGASIVGIIVDRLGVGVDDGANLNAPNSSTHRSAGGTGGSKMART